MVEFWDAGFTDTGREEEAAGDIQDTFHKRYARQTLELDSGGRVKAVRLYLYIVRSYMVHKCTCQVLSGLVYSNKPLRTALSSCEADPGHDIQVNYNNQVRSCQHGPGGVSDVISDSSLW